MKILLKKPLLVNCFKCSQAVEVKFNPGQGKYVQKNQWISNQLKSISKLISN